MSAAAGLRPKAETTEAIGAAIEANAASRRSAEARLAELRTARTAALTDPAKTAKQIAGLDSNIREIEIEIERLAASQPELETKLTKAEEAEALAEFEGQKGAADAACLAFREAVGAYEKAAKQIVAVCELCRAAEAAISLAKRTAFEVGAKSPEFDLAGFTGGSLADTVVLPRPGEANGLFWGRLPPPPPFVPTYAPMR
jgi:chromosome segregation ATPase